MSKFLSLCAHLLAEPKNEKQNELSFSETNPKMFSFEDLDIEISHTVSSDFVTAATKPIHQTKWLQHRPEVQLPALVNPPLTCLDFEDIHLLKKSLYDSSTR